LDQVNEQTRASSVGPIVELVPLPTSSQFLNVIEGAAQMKQGDLKALQREE
jgi:hypothetical protein